MGKLKHIVAREYITRIRKKAFIIMTFLGPVLFAAMMVVPVWLATLEDSDVKTIAVIEFDNFGKQVPDSSLQLRNVFKNKSLLKFEHLGDISAQAAETLVEEEAYFGVLSVRHNVLHSGEARVELIAQKQPSLGVEEYITNSIQEYLQYYKLLEYRVPPQVIKNLRTNVSVDIKKVGDHKYKNQELVWIERGIGYGSGFLIYMFIFFFGAQVMRGVVEEKTNRIIEVIVTSVKPFQLMMGKIMGIGLVGLTQFFAWIMLTFFILIGFQTYLSNKQFQEIQQPQPTELFQSKVNNQLMTTPQTVEPDFDLEKFKGMIDQIPFGKIVGMFLFYFIGGYLLYSAMFAAIGAAVDSETDTQQFMLPVTIPLIISLIVMMNAISNPEGQVAYWFSIIPFTSPVVMMARVGFNIPVIDLVISGVLLILTFIGITWLSGKIYRTGILMYGKKVNYKELWKWLRYK